MGTNPSVSARIVANGMSVIGLSADAASPRAVRTNGKLVLMLSRRVNGNIWEIIAGVTCPRRPGQITCQLEGCEGARAGDAVRQQTRALLESQEGRLDPAAEVPIHLAWVEPPLLQARLELRDLRIVDMNALRRRSATVAPSVVPVTVT